MTEATPRPWRSGKATFDAETWAAFNKPGVVHDIVQRGQDVIAVVWGTDDGALEDEANAALIAAAPDLIKALADFDFTMPPENAICHANLVPQSECANCKRIAAAIAALAKGKGAANEDV